jgi:hypothetical protein
MPEKIGARPRRTAPSDRGSRHPRAGPGPVEGGRPGYMLGPMTVGQPSRSARCPDRRGRGRRRPDPGDRGPCGHLPAARGVPPRPSSARGPVLEWAGMRPAAGEAQHAGPRAAETGQSGRRGKAGIGAGGSRGGEAGRGGARRRGVGSANANSCTNSHGPKRQNIVEGTGAVQRRPLQVHGAGVRQRDRAAVQPGTVLRPEGRALEHPRPARLCGRGR